MTADDLSSNCSAQGLYSAKGRGLADPPSGHSSWVMIASVYGRWIPNDGDTSGSKAAALFGTPVQLPNEDLNRA